MSLQSIAAKTALSKISKTKPVKKAIKKTAITSLVITTSFMTVLLANYGKQLSKKDSSTKESN